MKKNPKHIIIIGGSVTGLFSALALARQGHLITILEGESLPECDSPVEAFERWERRGAPQARHSHAFLARLHNGIRELAPDLYRELLAAGAERLEFRDMVEAILPDAEFIPEDDEIVLLACRRITFDWVLRRHVAKLEGVEYRDGMPVLGLLASEDPATGLPRVTGVRARDLGGEPKEIRADLVVDASGRNSSLDEWLLEIDADPLEREAEGCGIFYCSRFYKIHENIEPPRIEGPIGGDLGYLKYAIFLGDSRIFSITLAASPGDDILRSVRNPQIFDTVAGSLPATRNWVDTAVSEPVTEVYTYANLKNSRRFFVRDERPLALGLFPIGDSLMHQNPISGRGCTASWIFAWLLADSLAKHSEDPLAFARSLDDSIVRELVPWYEGMRAQDRAANATLKLEGEGGDPFSFQRDDGSVDPAAYMRSLMRDGLIPAMREDIQVLRAFMRVFNMLEAPADLLTDSKLLSRILAVWSRREQREPFELGPKRDEMLERIASATA